MSLDRLRLLGHGFLEGPLRARLVALAQVQVGQGDVEARPVADLRSAPLQALQGGIYFLRRVGRSGEQDQGLEVLRVLLQDEGRLSLGLLRPPPGRLSLLL